VPKKTVLMVRFKCRVATNASTCPTPHSLCTRTNRVNSIRLKFQPYSPTNERSRATSHWHSRYSSRGGLAHHSRPPKCAEFYSFIFIIKVLYFESFSLLSAIAVTPKFLTFTPPAWRVSPGYVVDIHLGCHLQRILSRMKMKKTMAKSQMDHCRDEVEGVRTSPVGVGVDTGAEEPMRFERYVPIGTCLDGRTDDGVAG